MRGMIRFSVLLAVAVATGACSDATSLDPDDLAGTWFARVAVATNPANTAESVDLIALGLSMKMELGADGSAKLTIDNGIFVEIESGSMSVSGNDVTLILGGSQTVGTISRDGDRIVLSLVNGIEWDFGNDGVDVPAILDLEFERIA